MDLNKYNQIPKPTIENKPQNKLNNSLENDTQKENQCLPSFLLKNEDDDYFDQSIDDESDENKDNTENNKNNNFVKNNSNNIKLNYSAFDKNTTQDNTTSNNMLNFSQNNILNDNQLLNNNNQFHYNHSQNYNYNNNNILSSNQIPYDNIYINHSFNNFIPNQNYNDNSYDYQFFKNNSFNNPTPITDFQINNNNNNFNSFQNVNPTHSMNFPGNALMLQTNINNQDNINNNNFNINTGKCLSFGNLSWNQNRNISDIKNKKHKSKKEKYLNDDILSQTNMTIKDLLDMDNQSLYKYIITQKGSRDVQIILKKVKENEVGLLISKLKNYLSDIIIDKYGNYFIQKLIQICLPFQRIQILESLNGYFVEVANSSYGTHPLQSLIETINMNEEKKIVLSYILGNENKLALDSKGTHILQKFISSTKDEDRIELNNNLINLIDKLIIDPFGVCVLIQLVKHTQDINIPKKIANYITNGGPLFFIQHPYANYAVQILINSTDLSYCDNIIETIEQNYLSLSMQKFSSNVVENCIKYGKRTTVKKIFKSIVEQEKLNSLLNNSYGNFVLEKLIARLNKDEKMILIKKIEKLGKSKSISSTIKGLLYKF